MDGSERKDVQPGLTVANDLKQDQRTGRLTRGVVREVLTFTPPKPKGRPPKGMTEKAAKRSRKSREAKS